MTARLPIWRMVQIAAHHYGQTPGEVYARSRKAVYQPARRAVALVADELDYSLPTIAHAMRRDDHSTALHARDRAKYFVTRDPYFSKLVDTLRLVADAYTVFGNQALHVWAEVERVLLADVGVVEVLPPPPTEEPPFDPEPIAEEAPEPYPDPDDQDFFDDWPAEDRCNEMWWGTKQLNAAILRAYPERCAA